MVDERVCRARTLAVHTMADLLGGVSICTGNLSEELLAQWTTGAYSGHFNLIGSLFKTEIYELATVLGVPDYVLDRPKVSSELRAGTIGPKSEEITRGSTRFCFSS